MKFNVRTTQRQSKRHKNTNFTPLLRHEFVNGSSIPNSCLRCARWFQLTIVRSLPKRCAYDMEDAASTPDNAHFHTSPNTSDTSATGSKHRRSPSGEEAGSESSSMTGSEDFEMDDINSGHDFEDDEETGLTSNQRYQRTRRKRRNTQMDERIAPDVDMKKEEERLTNRTVWTTILINTVLIALWYLFSISISVVSSKHSP